MVRAVRTARANTVYVGGPGLLDLYAERLPNRVRTVWHFSRSEREAIAGGANLALEFDGPRIVPVCALLTDEQGIDEDDPAALGRLEEFQERGRR